MVEKLLENIYRIEVPLPENPLKSLNSYLITGEERNLLIDTGFNREECLRAILDAFGEVNASLLNTDFFITHLHADHSGLVARLAGKDAMIYCSRLDGAIVNLLADEKYWDEMSDIFCRHGMPEPEKDSDKGEHPGRRFNGGKEIDFTFVRDGDVISVGNYHLRCIWTPGHTPGHMCLYDEEKELLFSGDHILGDITPVISIEKEWDRPLTSYLSSLQKIKKLPIKTILTAHRRKVADAHERIAELEKHHELRLQEVMDILKSAGGPKNAYEVASKMKWRISCKHWSEFPRQQRWFATGEAAAHMLHLREKGLLSREFKDGIYRFALSAAGN
jgi:glyoxylase-like metal-dependent hydrolase (beta-lactamase superfamily II)